MPEDHALMDAAKVQRLQKLYGILVSLLRGRPLLLVKQMEKERGGLDAMRILRKMDPRERARSLAIMRQLASWSFKEGDLHSQLIQFEEAVASYETASNKIYPEDLVITSIVCGWKEPLRSQVRLRMTAKTTHQEIHAWILQYEASTPRGPQVWPFAPEVEGRSRWRWTSIWAKGKGRQGARRATKAVEPKQGSMGSKGNGASLDNGASRATGGMIQGRGNQ